MLPNVQQATIKADELDDRDLLRRILVATAIELPLPKPEPAATGGKG